MKVRDVMTKRPVTIGFQETAQVAALKMAQEKIGSLLVVNNDEKVVGIITDRLLGLYLGANNMKASEIRVEEFMEENVISVSAEMDLSKAAKILEELEIRYLPVVEKGKLVGILSVSDIAVLIESLIDCILVELRARVKKKER